MEKIIRDGLTSLFNSQVTHTHTRIIDQLTHLINAHQYLILPITSPINPCNCPINPFFIVIIHLHIPIPPQDDFGQIPTNIVLVPSLLDGHHEFVFPQPPFGDRDRVTSNFFTEELGVLDVPFSKAGDIRRRVHLMPNPCMFRVNEGTTTINEPLTTNSC